MVTDPVMNLIEYIGIIAFAASGAIIAVQRKMDVLGVIILGVTTALGGGLVRDLMLGVTPPWMFIHSGYALIAASISLAVFIAACIAGPVDETSLMRIDGFINVFDALGLGAFAVSGVNTAITCGYAGNSFLCVFAGVLSAVGGGVLRDVLSATVPFVLQKRVYALACIAACMLYYHLCRANMQMLGAIAAVAMTVIIRFMAARYRWSLPRADSFRRRPK